MGALWILSWEWVSQHVQDCLLGSLQMGLPQCAWNPEETALNIAFLLLHGHRSANKIRTRLEGQQERNFQSSACRHLRATQQWMQLSFLHLSLPGSLLAWEPEFLCPKSSLTYLQPSDESYIPWFSFPSLGWQRLDLLQNICSRLRLSANQWTSGSVVGVADDAEIASGGQGAVTVWWCSWVLGSRLWVVDKLAHSCCDTEDLRGLAPWNLPSFGFWGMRSEGWGMVTLKLPVGKLVKSSAEPELD